MGGTSGAVYNIFFTAAAGQALAPPLDHGACQKCIALQRRHDGLLRGAEALSRPSLMLLLDFCCTLKLTINAYYKDFQAAY